MSGVSDKQKPRKKAGFHFNRGPDPRVLTLIIFQKLQKELIYIDESLRPDRAASIIRRSINGIPGFRAEKTRDEFILIVTNEASKKNVMEMNIRDAVDSLIIVWNDYRTLMERL